MRVDINNQNSAFLDLMEHPDQIVFLDANFFIPPDRSNLSDCARAFKFDDYKKILLEPLLTEFSSLSLHESVYLELVESSIKKYVDENIDANPAKIKVYRDSELDETEQALMCSFIDKLAVHSQYDPGRNNSKDRGEVLSLSYMAVKGFLYFAANDELPIRLIKNADILDTGLDDQGVIQMYELIYYLYKKGKYDDKALRILYKYQYYLTAREKGYNPEWGSFVKQMDALYLGVNLRFDEVRKVLETYGYTMGGPRNSGSHRKRAEQ